MLLCSSVFIMPLPVFATSIVVVLGDRLVTIAADSVLVGYTAKGEVVHRLLCKIRCFDRACFAASGRYNEETIGYDVWKFVDKELRLKGTPNAHSNRFKSTIDPLMRKIVDVARKETPGRFAEWQKGDPVLSYIFVGFDENGVSLAVSGEAKIDGKGYSVPIQESQWHGERGKVAAVYLGQNERIVDFVNRNPKWSNTAVNHPSEFAESMVRIEIQESQNNGRWDVGEPITIISLTANNGFALVKRGLCQDNK